MKLFPASASVQLEFEKVKSLLAEHCKTEYAREKALHLRIHTKKEFIDVELGQSHEYKLILQQGLYFPNDAVLNIRRDIKLLSIPGAVLSTEELVNVRKLAETIQQVFRWFDNERRIAFPFLSKIIENTYYEKAIQELINDVLDESGNVKDDASEELAKIRMSLYRKRSELRKLFDKLVTKLQKNGYVADIEESFLNGRKVVALFAEHKRQVKGILHGESDTRKTAFVEPEETIELNNEIFSLENEERNEVYRILRNLTAQLSVYGALLMIYYEVLGEFDLVRAKAKLAMDVNGNYPSITDRSLVDLKEAYHPLLYIYNRRNDKPTIPVNLKLDESGRILIISGPNAGGKTVTLKTVGLLQMMIQAGLLVPVHPTSEFGIFKQLFIHIGDTQSLEFELSTYSSHLKNMKFFIENSNGRTLFFIDELGSGSDPNLGGAFAEVILEELTRKHAYGIVTTHYLNLKVMASRVHGVVNGAMAFDETNLIPLYKLIIGKPGSSYTFSIAERIGLRKDLIERARQLVDEDHFRLDKLLNNAEQDLRFIENKEKELNKLIRENEKLKKEMQEVIRKEKHQQQVELLKQQNRISEERLAYLKDTERKLKAIVMEWRRSENKQEAMKLLQALLFKQNQKQREERIQKKLESKFELLKEDINIGSKVLMHKNRQVGVVKEIKGKNAVVQLGSIPITIALSELSVVKEKIHDDKHSG
jgi:DNA mismatch repair protein MutS2